MQSFKNPTWQLWGRHLLSSRRSWKAAISQREVNTRNKLPANALAAPAFVVSKRGLERCLSKLTPNCEWKINIGPLPSALIPFTIPLAFITLHTPYLYELPNGIQCYNRKTIVNYYNNISWSCAHRSIPSAGFLVYHLCLIHPPFTDCRFAVIAVWIYPCSIIPVLIDIQPCINSNTALPDLPN